MAENTNIEWAHHTFNPWWGCQRVSPGCENCYAEATDARWHDEPHWGPAAPRKMQSDAYWRKPLKWSREAADIGVRHRVFCASMADVFEDRRDLDESRQRLWQLIRDTPNLDWLLLTKRPENFNELLPCGWVEGEPWDPNVWLGVTAESQEYADRRIPILLNTPAAVRFVSYEPALGPIDLRQYLVGSAAWRVYRDAGDIDGQPIPKHLAPPPALHWVIAGAESGPGARPMNEQWIGDVRDQCVNAGVSFFYKQKVVDRKKVSLPLLDGRRWAEFPRCH